MSQVTIESGERGDWSELVQQARGGCSDALGRVLEGCRKYLLLVAEQELGRDVKAKEGASDAVQQTMMEAGRDFTQFHGTDQAALLAWLRQILHNNLKNTTRRYRATDKRRVDRERPLEDVLKGPHVGSLVSSEMTPSSAALQQEQLERLERALGNLTANHRRVVELRGRDGLSFAEVGRAMNRSEDAAQQLWTRAVLQLRKELNGH